jgi:hypothetical protein
MTAGQLRKLELGVDKVCMQALACLVHTEHVSRQLDLHSQGGLLLLQPECTASTAVCRQR